MDFLSDRLYVKTSGAIGDALGTLLGLTTVEPVTTVTGLLSPKRTRLAVPEGGEAAVPVTHMDDTARDARRLGRKVGAGVYGGLGALAGLAAVPAVAAGALPAAALLTPLGLGLAGLGIGSAAGHVLSPMAARTKVRALGDPYLRDRKDQTFEGVEVEKSSSLSPVSMGLADRLYVKTSGAYGDAVAGVLGAPAAIPAALMSPSRDAEGRILMDETAARGSDLGKLLGATAGAAYGMKDYVTGTPRGAINKLLGRKPGLYSTLARTALLGGLGAGLGGIAGGAGARAGARLRGNVRSGGGAVSPAAYEAPSYDTTEYEYYE